MTHSDEQIDIGYIPLIGLLGSGISYSLSPMLHEFAGEASGRRCDYQLFDVPPLRLDDFLAQITEFGEIVGFNITIPYKEIIHKHLAAIDDNARKIGAVNTVVMKDGQLIGHNTDYPAFASSLMATIAEGEHPVDGWTAVVIGAGGAARAVFRALLDLGIATNIAITSRSEDRKFFLLLELQEECKEKGINVLQFDWLDWENLPFDITNGPALLINATPLGSFNPLDKTTLPSPVPPGNIIGKFSLVFDIVYNPPVTRLVEVSRDAGIQAVGGGGMLIEQAVLSRSIWFGEGREEPERSAMVAAYSSWATKASPPPGMEV